MILRAQAKQHWAGTLSLMWTILRNTLYFLYSWFIHSFVRIICGNPKHIPLLILTYYFRLYSIINDKMKLISLYTGTLPSNVMCKSELQCNYTWILIECILIIGCCNCVNYSTYLGTDLFSFNWPDSAYP